jgi:hypothetical protein
MKLYQFFLYRLVPDKPKGGGYDLGGALAVKRVRAYF